MFKENNFIFKDQSKLVLIDYVPDLPGKKEEEVRIPDGTKTIETSALLDVCAKRLIFPSSVKKFKSHVISNYVPINSSLNTSAEVDEVIFEEGIETINDKAFEYSSIKSVKFPKSLKKIGRDTFRGTINLEEVTLSCKEIGTFAFSLSGIKKAVIEDSVEYVNELVFYQCRNLEEVIWNSKSFNLGMFSDCTALRNVEINAPIEAISNYSFQRTAIRDFVIPESVKYIENGAFFECKKLTSIDFSNVKDIDDYACAYCTNLASVNFKNEDVVIGEYVFIGTQLEDLKESKLIAQFA